MAEKQGISKKWTDEERRELMEKQERDLDEFIASLPKKQYTDGFTKENIEKEMEEHPAFMTSHVEGEEMPPLVEALAQLKYDPDENTPEELAVSYKDDGNFNFKVRKYKAAILSYTEALKQKFENAQLRTQLLTNRAAAHYHLENYRSSLNDCLEARKLMNDHIKAIVRGAQCYHALAKYEECKTWCREGLTIDVSNKTLVDLQTKAVKDEKLYIRDMRKQEQMQKKRIEEEAKLIQAIKIRNIVVPGITNVKIGDVLDWSQFQYSHPSAGDAKVHLLEDGSLVWPVVFLYPEYRETDFIRDFHENSTFDDYLQAMFNQTTEWDIEAKYTPSSIEIYFESTDEKTVHIAKSKTLLEVLADKRYLVKSGTPGFILLANNSEFQKTFLNAA